MRGAARCGARSAEVANFAPKAPQEPKAAREEMRHAQAASQNAAVAQDDLVAVGNVQERAQTLFQVGDDAAHGGRAVGGAHEEGSEEGFELVDAHHGRAAAEAAVGGQEDRVNVGESHHVHSLTLRADLFPSCPLIELG